MVFNVLNFIRVTFVQRHDTEMFYAEFNLNRIGNTEFYV
jgi:hypothetical protein